MRGGHNPCRHSKEHVLNYRALFGAHFIRLPYHSANLISRTTLGTAGDATSMSMMMGKPQARSPSTHQYILNVRTTPIIFCASAMAMTNTIAVPRSNLQVHSGRTVVTAAGFSGVRCGQKTSPQRNPEHTLTHDAHIGHHPKL